MINFINILCDFNEYKKYTKILIGCISKNSKREVSSMKGRIGALLLVAFLLINGCANSQNTDINKTIRDKDAVYINFVIPDDDLTGWVIDERTIKSPTPEIVVNELLKYPHIFPDGTKLLNIEVKDRIAYVDMSHEFDSYNNGTTATIAILCTIVNTLSLNKQLCIDGVIFLIDGEEVRSIGDFLVNEPILPQL